MTDAELSELKASIQKEEDVRYQRRINIGVGEVLLQETDPELIEKIAEQLLIQAQAIKDLSYLKKISASEVVQQMIADAPEGDMVQLLEVKSEPAKPEDSSSVYKLVTSHEHQRKERDLINQSRINQAKNRGNASI